MIVWYFVVVILEGSELRPCHRLVVLCTAGVPSGCFCAELLNGSIIKAGNPVCVHVCVWRGCQTGLAVNTCQLLTKDDI